MSVAVIKTNLPVEFRCVYLDQSNPTRIPFIDSADNSIAEHFRAIIFLLFFILYKLLRKKKLSISIVIIQHKLKKKI